MGGDTEATEAEAMKKRELERQIDELRLEVELLKTRIKMLEARLWYPIKAPWYVPSITYTDSHCTCGTSAECPVHGGTISVTYDNGTPTARPFVGSWGNRVCTCPVHGPQWTYTAGDNEVRIRYRDSATECKVKAVGPDGAISVTAGVPLSTAGQ